MIYSEMKKYSEANKDFSRAINLGASNPEVYYNRGVMRHHLKDKKGACADWKYASEYGDQDAYDLWRKACK